MARCTKQVLTSQLQSMHYHMQIYVSQSCHQELGSVSHPGPTRGPLICRHLARGVPEDKFALPERLEQVLLRLQEVTQPPVARMSSPWRHPSSSTLQGPPRGHRRGRTRLTHSSLLQRPQLRPEMQLRPLLVLLQLQQERRLWLGQVLWLNTRWAGLM